jgi:hypothetical protein
MFAEYLKCFQRFSLLNSDSKVRLGVYRGRIPWFSTRMTIGNCDVCVYVKIFYAISISSQLLLFGALAMPLGEVNINLINSVHMKQCDFHRTDFRGICYLGLSTKSCPTSIVVKSGKNKKYLHEDVQILEKSLMIRTKHSRMIDGKSRSLRYRYKNDITPFPRLIIINVLLWHRENSKCVLCKTWEVTFQELASSVFSMNIIINSKSRENNRANAAKCSALRTFHNLFVTVVLS